MEQLHGVADCEVFFELKYRLSTASVCKKINSFGTSDNIKSISIALLATFVSARVGIFLLVACVSPSSCQSRMQCVLSRPRLE